MKWVIGVVLIVGSFCFGSYAGYHIDQLDGREAMQPIISKDEANLALDMIRQGYKPHYSNIDNKEVIEWEK